MNSKEIVKRAVEMNGPERIPINIVGKDESDIKFIMYKPARNFDSKGNRISEWGYVWERLDKTLGQPKDFPIKDWSMLKNYSPPGPFTEGRTEGFEEFIEENKDKYILGGMGIMVLTNDFYKGFSNVLEDLYLERENLAMLADMVLVLKDIIKIYGKFKIDAVAFMILGHTG